MQRSQRRSSRPPAEPASQQRSSQRRSARPSAEPTAAEYARFLQLRQQQGQIGYDGLAKLGLTAEMLELQRRTGRAVRVLHTPAMSVKRTEAEVRSGIRRYGAENPHSGFMQQAVAMILL